MSVRRLIDIGDKEARETLGDYYILSKSRLENILICIERGAQTIKDLSAVVAEQQEQIGRLAALQLELEEEDTQDEMLRTNMPGRNDKSVRA